MRLPHLDELLLGLLLSGFFIQKQPTHLLCGPVVGQGPVIEGKAPCGVSRIFNPLLEFIKLSIILGLDYILPNSFFYPLDLLLDMGRRTLLECTSRLGCLLQVFGRSMAWRVLGDLGAGALACGPGLHIPAPGN